MLWSIALINAHHSPLNTRHPPLNAHHLPLPYSTKTILTTPPNHTALPLITVDPYPAHPSLPPSKDPKLTTPCPPPSFHHDGVHDDHGAHHGHGRNRHDHQQDQLQPFLIRLGWLLR